jgi:hypothetical protein
MRASLLFAGAVLIAAGVIAVLPAASAWDRGPSKVERATATFDFADNVRLVEHTSQQTPGRS